MLRLDLVPLYGKAAVVRVSGFPDENCKGPFIYFSFEAPLDQLQKFYAELGVCLKVKEVPLPEIHTSNPEPKHLPYD